MVWLEKPEGGQKNDAELREKGGCYQDQDLGLYLAWPTPHLYLELHFDLPMIHPSQSGIKIPKGNSSCIIRQHLKKQEDFEKTDGRDDFIFRHNEPLTSY